jgi:hypothetical protein
MNISSYNITDVGYHYIGLRALGVTPELRTRRDQLDAIRRGVVKYVEDRALRLMLPEPRGTFESVAPKICQELIHFGFAHLERNAYVLTARGKEVLGLLTGGAFRELRRVMIVAHLETYDNLSAVMRRHLEAGPIWRPIVEAHRVGTPDYLTDLLEPTFGEDANRRASTVSSQGSPTTPKQVEDALVELVLREVLPAVTMRVPLFRALADRLASLRLLNLPKAQRGRAEFIKSYTPAVAANGIGRMPWHSWLEVRLGGVAPYSLYTSEPMMEDPSTQVALLAGLGGAFSALEAHAGYYDLPDVRDHVCELLLIPEASFDEGVNRLLDLQPSPLTVSLQYERITGRRRPLVRTGGTRQISNLIRRV